MARSKHCEIEHAGPVDSCRRGAVLEHLLRLGTNDRLNRFLSLAGDAHVSDYVSGICFAHDIEEMPLTGAQIAEALYGEPEKNRA